MEDQTGVITEEKDVNTEPSSDSVNVDAGQIEAEEPKETLTEKEKALIIARDENARKAREAEDRYKQLEQELIIKNQQPEPEDDYDPDMPLTFADLKKIRDDEAKKAQAETQKKQTADFQKKVLSSVEKAKEKYKGSVHTYDWALEHARKNWSEEDLNAIALMKDPAQKLYDLVMLDTGNVGKESVKDALETVNKNLNSAGTLSETGGANKTLDSLKQVDKLSSKDFLEQMDEIKRSR